MTTAELKKMVAENIDTNEEGEEAVIYLCEKNLNNIILSGEDDDIDMSMPFNASKTTIRDSIITERAYKDMYLRDNVTFEDVIVKGVDLSDPHVYKCDFYDCIFENVNFSEYGCFNACNFEGCIFKDCSFNDINLFNNSFCFCYFDTCSFNGCDFEGSYLNESKMYDITLNNCKNIEFSDLLEIETTTN